MEDKTGVLGLTLGAIAGGMEASNRWLPSIKEINSGVILLISIASFILLLLKIRSVRAQTKLKDLEILEKQRQMKFDDERMNEKKDAKKKK